MSDLAAVCREMSLPNSTAQHTAQAAAVRFLRSDTPLMVWADVVNQSQINTLAERKDVFLFLSLGGRTPHRTAADRLARYLVATPCRGLDQHHLGLAAGACRA